MSISGAFDGEISIDPDMIDSNELCVQHTVRWVREFVIALNLCPFAKREMDRGSVRIQASSAVSVEDAITDLMREVEVLNTNSSIETTLLVFPFFLKDFFEYLDCVDLAESILHTNGYEGIYQLATFHPDYCFADANADDVTNYTNRSPYPMMHLLREEQIEQAITYYGDTEQIPENNIACLRKLGLENVKKMTTLPLSK